MALKNREVNTFPREWKLLKEALRLSNSDGKSQDARQVSIQLEKLLPSPESCSAEVLLLDFVTLSLSMRI
jgi:hypothetical protein